MDACSDTQVARVNAALRPRLRKFHELWANHGSQVGEQALRFYQALFRIERQIEQVASDERRRIRQRKSRRVLAVFYRCLLAKRQLVPPGSATIKAIDYSLKRWKELTHFVGDGDVPISNNWVENQIRPIAVGRSNWLFAGSLRAGKRAAAIMSLLHSARINGHDPYAYFKDVLERLPPHPASRIDELLPHRWCTNVLTPPSSAAAVEVCSADAYASSSACRSQLDRVQSWKRSFNKLYSR